MAASQIEKFPANLLGRQAVVFANRLGSDIAKRPRQPNQGTLQHIARFFARPHGRELAEHFLGQAFEPLASAANQIVERPAVAGPMPGQQRVQTRRLKFSVHGHRPIVGDESKPHLPPDGTRQPRRLSTELRRKMAGRR